MKNLGHELDYIDQPEFAKFWDADAAKLEAAVKSIGRCKNSTATRSFGELWERPMDRRSFVFGTAAVAAAGPAFAQDADPSRTITMVNE